MNFLSVAGADVPGGRLSHRAVADRMLNTASVVGKGDVRHRALRVVVDVTGHVRHAARSTVDSGRKPSSTTVTIAVHPTHQCDHEQGNPHGITRHHHIAGSTVGDVVGRGGLPRVLPLASQNRSGTHQLANLLRVLNEVGQYGLGLLT